MKKKINFGHWHSLTVLEGRRQASRVSMQGRAGALATTGSHDRTVMVFGLLVPRTIGPRPLVPLPWTTGTMCLDDWPHGLLVTCTYHVQARIQDFLKGGGGGEGQGGPLRGGVIAPVGEKLLFEHTTISATRGGMITPVTPPPPLDPPLCMYHVPY